MYELYARFTGLVFASHLENINVPTGGGGGGKSLQRARL